MAAVLSWALFGSWGIIGLAVLRLGRFRWGPAVVLLAPAVGFATLTIPTYVLVRWGVPVRHSAVPVGACLLAGASAVLWLTRPRAAAARLVARRCALPATALVAAFGLTAWPLFEYGFDWVANGNDDMANYCLMATGYRDHGYAHAPEVSDVLGCVDQTQAFWFSYIIQETRPGSEVLLAISSVWAGRPVVEVFMPVIAALNLALVAAAGGLATASAGRRAGALTAGLLAVSAATTYGVVQQLIAQAAGLGLLCVAVALVTVRVRRLSAGALARRAGALGVVFTGLLVFYPEVIPLLVGTCVALGLRDLVRRRLDGRHLAQVTGAVVIMTALMPAYLVGCVSFMMIQTGAAARSADWLKEMFPLYLTPRGPALVWGLLPLAGPEPEGAQSAAILLALALSAAVVTVAARGLWRGFAPAAVLAVSAALGAVLFVRGSGFGLFKLAMFVQPFLWSVVAGWVVARHRTRWAARAAVAAAVALVGLNVRVQFWYVDQSRGLEGRVELLTVSERHGLSEFRAEYARRLSSGGVDRVLIACDNTTLRKLVAIEVRGTLGGEVGVSTFDEHVRNALPGGERAPLMRARRDLLEPFRALRAAYAAEAANVYAVRDPDTGAVLYTPLGRPPHRGNEPERTLVVASGGAVAPLNRVRHPEGGPVVVCAPLSELHNFAVLCDASGARHHFLGMTEPDAIALYQLQADPAFAGRSAAGTGRAVLLDVLNPSPEVRVLVSHTASFQADPQARGTAPVRVVGDRRVTLGAVGCGASRLVSPPVAPQPAGPGRYLALEFGQPLRSRDQLAAAERLWGAELSRDRRRLTGYLRDASVLTEAEYAAFAPPPALHRFPEDLTHPHLEFSGLSEEGWVGREFKVRLTQPERGQEAVVRGLVPGVPGADGFRTTAVVLVDGRPGVTVDLGPGEFELRAPGGDGSGPRWITVRFSGDQTLPAPDGRRLSAHLRYVGFEPQCRPPEAVGTFPGDLARAGLAATGLYSDGWCAATFAVTCHPAAAGHQAVVRGEIPAFAGRSGYRTEVALLADGVEVARRSVGPGAFELRAPGGPAQGRRLECRFTNTQVLPPPDGRAVGALVRFVGFEPARQTP
ncbi:hypothetical protein GobsT_42080 [Gemmata obscuriglobus]|uniref:Uncharacterized protein n=1 Tax=Gemmata obscuriglobus TaxID=114 RepID=A0A2Z3H3V5_9BACT|nr:hypothetical protein [Gemmata obscuriglobus]AWM37775.1 hypothetical protein C1280_12730 [Gemmata obscuriglobus]QEG29412.1 hypothetical protein GobsT_42080 [Gemmata obscuriglobus]VTS08498.1 Di-and tricarboxylate transporter OS=Yersinia mollaretii ATCC 43969 GN=ymoll0001_10630 PE=4 SV=1 [Gemmata obscuriglobus UQM 2246]